jgi:hypothetical protein
MGVQLGLKVGQLRFEVGPLLLKKSGLLLTLAVCLGLRWWTVSVRVQSGMVDVLPWMITPLD